MIVLLLIKKWMNYSKKIINEDGFLLVKKPKGLSSYDVIRKIKKKIYAKKIGHSGTLDPFAEGLLIIGLNKGTKIFKYLDDFKEYIAKLTLGILTDTYDLNGKVIKKQKIKKHSKKEIELILFKFIGEYLQIPPIYSAIKKNGKPLYKYARCGEKINLKARKQIIYDIKLKFFDGKNIIFYVKCNTGTYIRSLAVDIAHKLKEIGYLSFLKRISISKYKISQAVEVEKINLKNIIPIKKILTNIKKININDKKKLIKIKNGNQIKIENIKDDLILIMNNDKLLSVYKLNKIDKKYYCDCNLIAK